MKNILFVDDEDPVLDGLRARLHREPGWSMTFVNSAAKALQELEQRPFDVIVTDIRMPKMDGAQLLQTVSTTWPEIVRIVLSGYAELQQAIKLAPVAHQFLSKPCEAQQLRNRIDRCLSLQEFLRKPALRTIVGRIRKLPTLPKTYSRLKDVMSREDACIADVAKIVAADAAVSAKVVQMVNSAFFRLARPIAKIEQAVAYLGFASVRNLVLSVEVFSEWSAMSEHQGPDLEKVQQHALHVAEAATSLSGKSPLADDILLAALLHDIGYWIIAQECRPEFAESVRLAVADNLPLHVAETQVLGASHAEIGAYLLGLWGLPYSVIEAVALHHAPAPVDSPELDVLSALTMAHALTETSDATALGVGEGVLVPAACGAIPPLTSSESLTLGEQPA